MQAGRQAGRQHSWGPDPASFCRPHRPLTSCSRCSASTSTRSFSVKPPSRRRCRRYFCSGKGAGRACEGGRSCFRVCCRGLHHQSSPLVLRPTHPTGAHTKGLHPGPAPWPAASSRAAAAAARACRWLATFSRVIPSTFIMLRMLLGTALFNPWTGGWPTTAGGADQGGAAQERQAAAWAGRKLHGSRRAHETQYTAPPRARDTPACHCTPPLFPSKPTRWLRALINLQRRRDAGTRV